MIDKKTFDKAQEVNTVNSNQSLLMTDKNGNVTKISLEALKADLSLGCHTWCGRVWNTANATPKAAMVVGDIDVLRELPLTLGLGAYLVKNDHSRRKLDATDHYKYATGEPAKLDGSQGHYQWGWGREFYFVTKDVGGLHYEMIGLKPIPGELNYKIPIGSISAAGFATLERSTGRLVSFINTGSDYRGGNNDATLDGTNRTLCGKPASSQTTEYFRAAARKNGKGWLCTTMRHTTIIAALIGVIMGTHYDQDAVNAAKDSNGLYQGGLGAGTTGFAWDKWTTYNSNRPFLPMSAGIELGDSVGETTYSVKNDDGTVAYTAKVSSFFGLKHAQGGYLWRMMDDEQVRINSDTTATHLVAPSIYGTWTVGSATGMTALSTSPASGEGYITRLSMEHLENFATAIGGSETTYWTSYFWNTSKATSGFRLCLRGAHANNGGLCGSSTLNVNVDVSFANGHLGAALCEAASEWSLEPEYYAAA